MRDGAGALFFGALAATLAGFSSLSAYEALSLARHHEPITHKTRRAHAEHPVLTAIATLGAGVLLGHLFWPDKERP